MCLTAFSACHVRSLLPTSPRPIVVPTTVPHSCSVPAVRPHELLVLDPPHLDAAVQAAREQEVASTGRELATLNTLLVGVGKGMDALLGDIAGVIAVGGADAGWGFGPLASLVVVLCRAMEGGRGGTGLGVRGETGGE